MGISQQPPDNEGDTGLLEKPDLKVNDGDHDRFSHYVKKEKILQSAMSGKAIRALCGKKWIPSRDPERFPICPICKEIYSGLRPAPEDK
jgi:Protein of unknown function (DUF3039)